MNYFNPHSVVAMNDSFILGSNGKFFHKNSVADRAIHELSCMGPSNIIFNAEGLMINFRNVSQCHIENYTLRGFTITGANFKLNLSPDALNSFHLWNGEHGVLS